MPLPETLFDPGQVVGSPAAIELLRLAGVDPCSLIDRHISGDFGEVGIMKPGCLIEGGSEYFDGLALNSLAVNSNDYRILSRYRLPNDERVYVETVADRANTTIHLPEDY